MIGADSSFFRPATSILLEIIDSRAEWSQPPTRRKLLVVLVPRRRGRRVALTSGVNGPLCGGRHRSRRRRQGRPIRPLGHQSYVEGTAPQVQGRGGGVE